MDGELAAANSCMMCVCVHIYIYIYIYVHIFIYTYIHIYIYSEERECIYIVKSVYIIYLYIKKVPGTDF